MYPNNFRDRALAEMSLLCYKGYIITDVVIGQNFISFKCEAEFEWKCLCYCDYSRFRGTVTQTEWVEDRGRYGSMSYKINAMDSIY